MLTLPLTTGVVRAVDTTIEGNRYRFTTKWNDRFKFYSLDISVNGVEVVHGCRILFGVDMFAAYTQIPINRVYAINKLGQNDPILFDGLDADKGLVVVIEDSDLEV